MPHRRVFVPEGYEVALIDATGKNPEFTLRPTNPELAPNKLITVAENFFPPRHKEESEDLRIAAAEEWRYLVIVTNVGCLLYSPKSGRTFPGPVRWRDQVTAGIGYINAKNTWMVEHTPVAQHIYEQVHRVRLERFHDKNPWNFAIRNLTICDEEVNKKLFTYRPSRQYMGKVNRT